MQYTHTMAEDAWAVSDHGQVAPSRSSDVDTSAEGAGDSSDDGEEGEGEGGEGEDEGQGWAIGGIDQLHERKSMRGTYNWEDI